MNIEEEIERDFDKALNDYMGQRLSQGHDDCDIMSDLEDKVHSFISKWCDDYPLGSHS